MMTRLANLRRSFPTLMLLAVPLRWIGKSRRRILGAALLMIVVFERNRLRMTPPVADAFKHLNSKVLDPTLKDYRHA
jgi:hypothetical protein